MFLHLFYCHTDDTDSHRFFYQELKELKNYCRRKRRMAQRKEFSNSQILDKKKICENLWNLCDEKKGRDYEETKDHRASGEGDSSRAHGIPDGTGNDQLHGSA